MSPVEMLVRSLYPDGSTHPWWESPNQHLRRPGMSMRGLQAEPPVDQLEGFSYRNNSDILNLLRPQVGDEMVGPRGPWAEFGVQGDAVGTVGGHSPFRPELPPSVITGDHRPAGETIDPADITADLVRELEGRLRPELAI